eukprot:scaffold21988_cov63-Phaeocystis_antarctica.AAC.3
MDNPSESSRGSRIWVGLAHTLLRGQWASRKDCEVRSRAHRLAQYSPLREGHFIWQPPASAADA